MNNLQKLNQVLREFNLDGVPQPLTGGTTQTFRVGDAVVKRIRETSLENNHSPELAAWIAAFSARIPQSGFRLPQPLPTIHQTWITAGGWIATSFLEGRHAAAQDVPACIQAIHALHAALKTVEKHPAMDDNRTAWGYAHRCCWGEKPEGLQPQLRGLVGELYALRKPVKTSTWQLIHGDLNPSNILIATGPAPTPPGKGLSPAILDFTPFWAPPEFALAIFANFAGPRRFDMSVLRYFEGIPGFDQLLVRAAIRMLLVVAALNGLDGWETSEEKWAAEQIIQHVCRRSSGI